MSEAPATDTTQNRYLGRIAMICEGVLLIQLRDNRRVSVLPNEADASEFRAGQEVALSLFSNGDGLRGYDISRS